MPDVAAALLPIICSQLRAESCFALTGPTISLCYRVGATFNASIAYVRYSSGEPLRFGSAMEQKPCCAPSYIADMRCGTYFRRLSRAPTECFPQGLKIFLF